MSSHEGASKKIIENLDRPFGLAFHEDLLYVAEPTSVKRYKYDAEAMTAGEGEEIIAFGDTGKGHWTRSLLFNADHSKLYVTVGSGSNIDLGEDPIRAALHRYNPDGSGHETVATGLRNVIGLQWRPGSSDLWGAVQERDGLGDDLVCRLSGSDQARRFLRLALRLHGADTKSRATKTSRPTWSRRASTRMSLLGAHVAVLDMRFYTGDLFPKNTAADCSWPFTAPGTAPSASATAWSSFPSRTAARNRGRRTSLRVG